MLHVHHMLSLEFENCMKHIHKYNMYVFVYQHMQGFIPGFQLGGERSRGAPTISGLEACPQKSLKNKYSEVDSEIFLKC